ncbi:hypothetical protein BGX34_004017 [Mortierella sp. NVP85]|nr:hypothetical protein BGX34_004017 [Mortierella sp. NVP85]
MNSNNTIATEHATVVLSKHHTRDIPHNDDDSNSGESIPCERAKTLMPGEAVCYHEVSYEYGIYLLCRSSASDMSDAIIADAQHIYTVVNTTTSTLRQETSRQAHLDYPAHCLGQTPLSDIEQADSTSFVSMIPSFTTQRIRPIDSATSSGPIPQPPTKADSRVCGPNLARDIVCQEISVGVHSFNKKDHRGESLEYVDPGRLKKRLHWKSAEQRKVTVPPVITDPVMARCRMVVLGTEEEGVDHMAGTDILTARLQSLKAMQTPEILDEGNSGDMDPSALLLSSEDFRNWAVQADRHPKGRGDHYGLDPVPHSEVESDHLGSTRGLGSVLAVGDLYRFQPSATVSAATFNQAELPSSLLARNTHGSFTTSIGTCVPSATFRDDERESTISEPTMEGDREVVYDIPGRAAMEMVPSMSERPFGVLHDHLSTHVCMLDEMYEHEYSPDRNLPDADNDNDTGHGYYQYYQQDTDGHPGSQQQQQQQNDQQQQESQQQQQNDQHQYSVDGYNYTQPHHSHHNRAISQESSGTARMDRTPPALPAVPLPNEPIPHQIRRVQSAYISSLHMQWEQQQQQRAQQQQQQHSPYPGSVPMSRHRTVPQAPTDGPMVRLGGVPMSRTTFDPLTMEQRPGVAQRQVSWEVSMTPHDGESSSSTLPQHTASTVYGAGAMTEGGQGQNGHYFQTNHGGSAPRPDRRPRRGDEEIVGR